MINTFLIFMATIGLVEIALLIMMIWSVIYLFRGKNKKLKWVMGIFLFIMALIIGFIIAGVYLLR